eukprot:366035-Chlamydomonas_euryale.AAC.2
MTWSSAFTHRKSSAPQALFWRCADEAQIDVREHVGRRLHRGAGSSRAGGVRAAVAGLASAPPPPGAGVVWVRRSSTPAPRARAGAARGRQIRPGRVCHNGLLRGLMNERYGSLPVSSRAQKGGSGGGPGARQVCVGGCSHGWVSAVDPESCGSGCKKRIQRRVRAIGCGSQCAEGTSNEPRALTCRRRGSRRGIPLGRRDGRLSEE